MKVKDFVRTDIPSVSPEDSLAVVKEEMALRRADAVMVRTDDEILGLITDTDIINTMASGKDPEEVLARDFMTACELAGVNPCIQLHEEDELEDALKVMADNSVRHLLVWGEGNKPVGVLCSHTVIEKSERK
jgi:predicted transcriptional regulator